MKSPPKWQEPPLHPANNAPLMSDAELTELANDIKAHGMHEPIVLWRDNREEANGAEGPFPVYLLDGRNRLEALKRIGITDPFRAPPGNIVVTTVRTLYAVKEVWTITGGRPKKTWETACDPYAFHTSMNAYRRHLTADQRRWLIKQEIMADPTASNRMIARETKTSRNTVAEVRDEMVSLAPESHGDHSRGGRLAQNAPKDHLPIERAMAALRENPSLTKRQLMEQVKCGSKCAVNARRKLVEAGEIVDDRPRKPGRKPKAKARPTPASSQPSPRKPSEKDKALDVITDLMHNVVAKLVELQPADGLVRYLAKNDLVFSEADREQIREASEWLDALYVASVPVEDEPEIEAAPTAPSDESLVWKQSLISVTLDDSIAYHELIADIAEAVSYQITVVTKPNSLTFSHYVVSLNRKVIGRAHALDEAKALAQKHADANAKEAA